MSGLRLGIVLWVLLFSGLAHASYSFDNTPRASDAELDRMRGGFIVNLNGLEFLMAFSLERLTYINGELVSSVTLNPFAMTPLEQLGKIGQMVAGLTVKPSSGTADATAASAAVGASSVTTASAATSSSTTESTTTSPATTESTSASTASNSPGTTSYISAQTADSGLPSGTPVAAPLTQPPQAQAALDTVVSPGAQEHSLVAGVTSDAGTSETVASASQLTQGQSGTTGAAQSSVTTAGSQPAQSSTSASTSTVASRSASPQVTSQGTLTVIQNGPGNSIALPANISAGALTTVIQNSLNDQVIRNVTIMNATIASKMLEAQARLDAMLSQSLNGLR